VRQRNAAIGPHHEHGYPSPERSPPHVRPPFLPEQYNGSLALRPAPHAAGKPTSLPRRRRPPRRLPSPPEVLAISASSLPIGRRRGGSALARPPHRAAARLPSGRRSSMSAPPPRIGRARPRLGRCGRSRPPPTPASRPLSTRSLAREP
jgi:hypothetical protein